MSKALHQFVQSHPRLFVLTGAGCSTAAGLGDYRDANGQWKRPQPITGQSFINDTHARKRYWARSAIGWPSFAAARPAAAHHALATLQSLGYVSTLVTQNVDELHQQAGHTNVVDLHGVLSTVSCIDCETRLSRNTFQEQLISANPWLADLSAAHAPDGDADLELEQVDRVSVPHCPACSGLLKPDVVFFGENVSKSIVENAMNALANADALLVAGSSLMVFSGFRFCRAAANSGQPIAIVNHGKTRADDIATIKISGDVGTNLQYLVRVLA
ncbi:MAG: NAD-dependent protein deacetylase [Acidiferrobacterales bacterium]|nr:NAD-dependent protein deacetylase [Acidiferrobacterales bacterium]